MNKNGSITTVYLFTFISFIVTFLFIYIFVKIAPQFYTGFDRHTSKNILSILADILFIIMMSANIIGISLCTIHTYKVFSNKLGRKS
ncbi:MAG: hypothetical protein RBR71_09975 [Gudongella sp.]|nr:hypothetical protein [Gudongella sp.]